MKISKYFFVILLILSQFSFADTTRRDVSYLTGQQVLDNFSRSELNIDGLFIGNSGRCSATLIQNDDATYGVFIFKSNDQAYQVAVQGSETYNIITNNTSAGVLEYTIKTAVYTMLFSKDNRGYSATLYQGRRVLANCNE